MKQGTAGESRRRLAMMSKGTTYKDPDTGELILVKKEREGIKPLDLFDPEALSDKQEREKKKKKR